MKLKICIIIICLIVFGCKSKQEPVYITRIGQLTPGNGGRPYLETYEGWGGGDYNTHPFGKTVKVIGEENNEWVDLGDGRKRYDLQILVKSMEVIEPEE